MIAERSERGETGGQRRRYHILRHYNEAGFQRVEAAEIGSHSPTIMGIK